MQQGDLVHSGESIPKIATETEQRSLPRYVEMETEMAATGTAMHSPIKRKRKSTFACSGLEGSNPTKVDWKWQSGVVSPVGIDDGCGSDAGDGSDARA
jgi:hypothetical protein